MLHLSGIRQTLENHRGITSCFYQCKGLDSTQESIQYNLSPVMVS
jgi:hypothetical protein